jgi:hypothetical protein
VSGDLTKALAFKRKNEGRLIVSMAWKDEAGRNVTGGPETWVKNVVRFDDGTQLTVRPKVIEILDAMGFEPRWWGVK